METPVTHYRAKRRGPRSLERAWAHASIGILRCNAGMLLASYAAPEPKHRSQGTSGLRLLQEIRLFSERH